MGVAHEDILAALDAGYERSATFPGTLSDGTLYV